MNPELVDSPELATAELQGLSGPFLPRAGIALLAFTWILRLELSRHFVNETIPSALPPLPS